MIIINKISTKYNVFGLYIFILLKLCFFNVNIKINLKLISHQEKYYKKYIINNIKYKKILL